MKHFLPFLLYGLAASTRLLGQATFTWDSNTSTTGAQAGAGAWNTSNANWWNGTSNTSFVAIDHVVFGVAAANAAHSVALTVSANLFFSGTTTDGSHNMHFVLNGANTGFIAGVEINGNADLALTNSSALFSANAITFNAATGTRASLFLFGQSVTIGSLNDTSAGTRWIRNGARNLTIGGTNSSNPAGGTALGINADSTLTIQQSTAGTFGGVISDGPNGNGNGIGFSATDYRKLAIFKNGNASLSLTVTFSGLADLASFNEAAMTGKSVMQTARPACSMVESAVPLSPSPLYLTRLDTARRSRPVDPAPSPSPTLTATSLSVLL